jgi:hypothetical protein
VTPYRANQAAILKAFVTAHPGPWTISDLARALKLGKRQTQQAVKDFREICGLMEDVTLICEPNGKGQPWLYRLVGRPDDSAWWEAWTVIRLHTTAETAKAVPPHRGGSIGPRCGLGHRKRDPYAGCLDVKTKVVDGVRLSTPHKFCVECSDWYPDSWHCSTCGGHQGWTRDYCHNCHEGKRPKMTNKQKKRVKAANIAWGKRMKKVMVNPQT